MDTLQDLDQASLIFNPDYQKRMLLMDEALAALDQAAHPDPNSSPYPTYFDDRLLKIIDSVTLE